MRYWLKKAFSQRDKSNGSPTVCSVIVTRNEFHFETLDRTNIEEIDNSSEDSGLKQSEVEVRKSIKSLPEMILKAGFRRFVDPLPSIQISYLCYLRLPKLNKNFKGSTPDGRVLSNILDFVQVKNNLHNLRHADEAAYDKFLLKLFKEYNFSVPQYFPEVIQGLESPPLTFTSIFSGGNLQVTIKVACLHQARNHPDTYYLEMGADTNSLADEPCGYFNFCVKGGIRGRVYTFHVVNFKKDFDILPGKIRNAPWIYSRKRYKNAKLGWTRVEGEVNFFENRDNEEVNGFKKIFEQAFYERYKRYRTLTFQAKWLYNNDTLQICSGFPYEQRDLMMDLAYQTKLVAICKDKMY